MTAVLGFAGAAFAMLQVAADRRFRRLARFSLFSAIAVAVIAATGGLLSVLRFGTQVGGMLEFVATTIALLWLVGLATVLAVTTARERVGPDALAVGAGTTDASRQVQPSRDATPASVAATYSE
jgi:putative copper export protein